MWLCGRCDPTFQVEDVALTNHFCTDSWANECLKTSPLTVFTQVDFLRHQMNAKHRRLMVHFTVSVAQNNFVAI